MLLPCRRLTSPTTVQRITTKRTLRYNAQSSATTPLKGKTIIVTGASRGIGLAIAEKFACRGASKVVLIGRNEVSLNQVTNAINQEADVSFREHVYRAGDVADRLFWVELGKEWVCVSLSQALVGTSSSGVFGYSKLRMPCRKA